MPQVDIVIVNWNGGAQLRRCLDSISRVADSVLIGTVVVVDNNSNDGSPDNLEQVNLPLHVIRNSTNRGFGAACNQGASICKSPYLLFLNPDTEVESTSLSVPLHFLESHRNRDVGVCGIQLVNATGEVSRSCARLPSSGNLIANALGLPQIAPAYFRGVHLSEWSHDSTRDVDHVIGAFYFIRRELFDQIRGFDERYFVYLEDLDLSHSVTQLGKRIVYLTSAKAFHRGGGTSDQVKSHRLFYSRRSRIQYSYKHFGRFQALSVTLATLFIEPLLMVLRGLIHRSPREIGETLFGFKMLWSDLPNWSRWCRRRPVALAERPEETGHAKAA